MTTIDIVPFVQRASKGANSQFAERANGYTCTALVWFARVAEHLDKPGFDELVELLDLLIQHRGLESDCVEPLNCALLNRKIRLKNLEINELLHLQVLESGRLPREGLKSIAFL